MRIKCNIKFFSILAALAVCATPALVNADRLAEISSPISAPTIFEDPRIENELRPIFIYHQLDEDFVTQGGNVRIFALQARFKVTDDLAIIATKDGYVQLRPDAVLPDEDGFGNVALGAKYALYQCPSEGQIVTAGLRYEIPMGDDDVLEGEGDGSFNPFVSAATAVGPMNVVASTGFRLPIDDEDSSFYDANLHFDTALDFFHPALEFNLVHTIDGGGRLPIADESPDYFNFGSVHATGQNIVTGAVGGRFDLSDSLTLGVAYQVPLNRGTGSNVTDWRVTTDLQVKF
jgi:hypothetical protein